MPCSLAGMYHRFGGTYIPQDCGLSTDRYVNLKSHALLCTLDWPWGRGVKVVKQ